MTDAADIRNQIRALFSDQKLGVLATHSGGQPYANLIAFAASDDLRFLTFATPKTTRKFANLVGDARTAFLVHSGLNDPSDFHRAISVTAVGKAEEITPDDDTELSDAYRYKHPYLSDFIRSPTSVFFRIHVQTYYLVRRFQHVMELHLRP